jgi:hypothetical protein
VQDEPFPRTTEEVATQITEKDARLSQFLLDRCESSGTSALIKKIMGKAAGV